MVGSRRQEDRYLKHKPCLIATNFEKNRGFMAEKEESILESAQRREATIRNKETRYRMRNRPRPVVRPVSVFTARTLFDFRIL